ncbi:YqgE/AlgH family protein [Roseovarius sp. D0-M9]|uniref:YqgE/AlgH family protein n=1 Tax=Roseovarius sp. D0-M9 TaxID=3127117 RepID=UPI00300FD1C7
MTTAKDTALLTGPALAGMDLTGRILIAMPGMADPRFDQSVIFVCAHSDEGAMGLVLNKVADDLRLADLLEQLDIEAAPNARRLPIHYGGPVESGRGFVLHDGGYASSISTLEVTDDFSMTATLDILEDMASGEGPDNALIALGYAGWGPGQLEGEIAENAWLICDASAKLIFGTMSEGKWAAALATLGISPVALSADFGTA